MLLSACLCAFWVAAGSPALAADLSFHSGGLPTEPFSLERGEDVLPQLLDRLAEKALRNRSMAKEFACMEKIYRDDDLARVFDYLLATSAEADVQAIRFRGRRKASFSDSFPPPFAWGLLFSDANQPYFVFRYQGESLDGADLAHKIAFRGSHAFEKGTALPEWKGS